MPDLCNVDGRILRESEATIPVLDRGFLFGDSVYEVFRTRHGVPFAWREHLGRLRESADAIAVDVDVTDRELMQRVVGTIAASGGGPGRERYVRLIVTRGSGTSPTIDPADATGPLRIVVMVRDLPTAKIGHPTRAALVRRRAAPGRESDPSVKSGNYLTNIVGLAEARRRGAEECIFVDDEGFATEASTANLYAVLGGALHTPPLGAGLLAGITRRFLLVCAGEAGVEVCERRLPSDELLGADEVFLSGTVRDLAPVTHLDDRPIGDGRPGVVTDRLRRAFDSYCEKLAVADADALRAVGVAPCA